MGKVTLVAPNSYNFLSDKDKEKICNGCGAKGGIDVPDTMYLLSVTEACNIHDYMWEIATTVDEVYMANEVFWSNLQLLIKDASWLLKGLRLARAHKYYLAVQYIGAPAYIKKKGLK